MKRTISSILAVVMAMAMVLSMTVFASAADVTHYYIRPGTIDPETEPNAIELLAVGGPFEHAVDGEKITITATAEAAGAYGYYFVINTPDLIQESPYLVWEVESGADLGISFYGWDANNVAIRPYEATNEVGTYPKEAGKHVFDLTNTNQPDSVSAGQGLTMQFWFMGAADSEITFSLYLTNDPNADLSGGGNGGDNGGDNGGGNTETGVESAVAVAAAAVIGAGALIAISRKK